MAGALQRQFQLLADYNQWANGRLYAACAQLGEDQLTADRSALFGSILGTLNHILVGDRSWLERLKGRPPAGYALDQVLYGSLADLTAARVAEDTSISEYVRNLSENDYGDTVQYQNTRGVPFENLVSDILTHVFNHQTHHRGQVHDLLSQTEIPPPELDLIFYMREK